MCAAVCVSLTCRFFLFSSSSSFSLLSEKGKKKKWAIRKKEDEEEKGEEEEEGRHVEPIFPRGWLRLPLVRGEKGEDKEE